MSLLLVLIGCASPDDDGLPEPTGTPSDDTGLPASTAETGTSGCGVPSLTLGTGVTEYTPLPDGGSAQIVFGPQGGWHVDTAGFVVAADQILQIQPRMVLDDGTLLTGELPPVVLAALPGEPCTHTYFGVRALFDLEAVTDDPPAYVCDLDGREAMLSVVVRDFVSVELNAEVSVVLIGDPKQECPD